MHPTTSDIKMHIAINKSMIEGATLAVLPGDPGRVRPLAMSLDPEAKHLASNREYTSFLATYLGHKIVICSTGIGGPSTAIAIEELAQIGVKDYVRVGTCGAIVPHIEAGEIIVTKASVRLDGASYHYAPPEYPAVASFELTESLVAGLRHHNISYHIGITASSDTFYPGQERYDTFSNYVLPKWQGSMEMWHKLNVLNFEMESATLLTVCAALGLHAACFCGVIANRTRSEKAILAADFHQNLLMRMETVLKAGLKEHLSKLK